MSVYYSIIYVCSALQERIAIGLILTDGTTVLSKFSDYKINIITNFFDIRGQQLFKDEVQALKRGLSKETRDYAHQQAFAAKAHLQKLSIYNNNLWTVSAPSDIMIDLNEDSLHRLFTTYISKIETHISRKETFDMRTESLELVNKIVSHRVIEMIDNPLKTNFYPRIQERVDIEYVLKTKEFPTLFTNVKIDFIGLNEKIVVGQAIDFEQRRDYLNNTLSTIDTVQKAFQIDKKVNTMCYLIGNEPIKHDCAQHKLWEMAKKHPNITVVPIDEVEQISLYLENHDVKPYSTARLNSQNN